MFNDVWCCPIESSCVFRELEKRNAADAIECGLARSMRNVAGLEFAYPKMRRELMVDEVMRQIVLQGSLSQGFI